MCVCVCVCVCVLGKLVARQFSTSRLVFYSKKNIVSCQALKIYTYIHIIFVSSLCTDKWFQEFLFNTNNAI